MGWTDERQVKSDDLSLCFDSSGCHGDAHSTRWDVTPPHSPAHTLNASFFFCCGWKSSSGEALQGNSQKVKRTPKVLCFSAFKKYHCKVTRTSSFTSLISCYSYRRAFNPRVTIQGGNTLSPGPVSLLSEITHPNIPRTSSVHHSVLTRAADLRVHISQSCSNTNLPWNIWRTKFSSWDHSKCSSLNEHLKSPQPSTLKGLY